MLQKLLRFASGITRLGGSLFLLDLIVTQNAIDMNEFLKFTIVIVLIVQFFVGLYKLMTIGLVGNNTVGGVANYMHGWDYRNGNRVAQNPNIDTVLRFRESAMSNMTQSEASELYVKTGWVDGVMNGGGSNVDSAKSFLNSKLSTMTQSEGLDYIKNLNK